MAKALVLLILLAHAVVLNCQEEYIVDEEFDQHSPEDGNPTYSFGYGVSDARTGDIKSVWEEKAGDTVKGHYSVLEADGSMRTVEYSSGPNTGFTASVNHDELQPQIEQRQSVVEEKALRDQERFYDFSEDADQETYPMNEKKRKKHPFDSLFKDYSVKKRPKYPMDLEPSEYTHSISIKHPRDEYDPIGEAHSHIGFNSDPNCKTKHKKENPNLYTSVTDFDFRKQKYPSYDSDSYKEAFDKYIDPSNINIEKLIQLYKYNEQYNRPLKQDELTALPTSVKYSYPVPPDAPPENIYPDNISSRPKKKARPHKKPESYPDDLDDYILVPKKKYKKPPRVADPVDYQQEMDEEYDHPSGFDDGFDDDRHHKPPRGTAPKEVVRKIVKKRKPIVNLLDIFDI